MLKSYYFGYTELNKTLFKQMSPVSFYFLMWLLENFKLLWSLTYHISFGRCIMAKRKGRAVHGSEKANHGVCWLCEAWTKDTRENEPSVIKPTNHKNSDGLRGNTAIVRRNLQGIAGDSKVNGLKTKRSEGTGISLFLLPAEAQIFEGEVSPWNAC